MKLFHLHREQFIAQSLETVFEFFANPSNLEELTPPWMSFGISGCSEERIGEGTQIDYRLRVRGIPLRWRSEITGWSPPHEFTDVQLRGPYRRWVHRHSFRAVNGGTQVCDDVEYAVLGGALVERVMVRPDLERIFNYRQERLPEMFPDASSRTGN